MARIEGRKGEVFSNDVQVKALPLRDKPYVARDAEGSGLALHITSGGKTWRYDFRFAGVRKSLTLGRYPAVSLKQARDLLKEAKAKIAQGIDPALEKQRRKREQAAEARALQVEQEDRAHTVASVCAEWFSLWEKRLAASTTKNIAIGINHIVPVVGNVPIKAVVQDDLLKILRKLEGEGKYSAATLTCSVIKRLFRFAKLRGYLEQDVSESLELLLMKGGEHVGHAAVTDPEQVGELLRKIEAFVTDPPMRTGIVSLLAMRIFPYVPLRSQELVGAQWSELDLENATLTIPAARMKTRRQFVMYLSRQAVAVFRELERIRYSDHIFQGTRANGHLSVDGVKYLFARAGVPTSTQSLHGWRSTFSSLCNTAGAPFEIVESCLSHAIGNQISRAYNRATLETPRRRLMQWYADCLDSLREGGRMLALDVSQLYS